MLTSVINNVLGEGRPKSTDICEQMAGCRIEVDSHLIDTAHHRLVE